MNSSFHFKSHIHNDVISTDGLRCVLVGILVFVAAFVDEAILWCLSFLIALFNSSRALQTPSEITCRMHLNENSSTDRGERVE